MLTTTQLETIHTLLDQFGYNETERSLYLLGREIGPSTVIQIAEKSGLKRVTVHATIKKLIQQGLFRETRRGKKRLLEPAPFESLQHQLKRQYHQLDQLTDTLEHSRPLFDHLKSLTEHFPKVRIMQGREGLNTTLLEMANDQQDVYVINDAHTFNELIDHETLHRSYQSRAQHKVKTSMIFPEGFQDFWHLNRDDDYLIHIKTLPPSAIIDGGVEIRGDKVALHCYREGHVTTTLLQNPEIASIMKQMFASQWQLAKDYLGSFVMV